MTYRFTRTVGFKSIASMLEAMPTCLKIVEHITKDWKMEAHLMAPTLGGHPGRVVFVVNCDDLNALQDAQSSSVKDKKYLTLLGKLSVHIDGTMTNDQTWKILV